MFSCLLQCMSLLLAPLRQADRAGRGPLIGVERKSSADGEIDVIDPMYGPAVRCKPNVNKRRALVLRICIRPLHGAFVLLAIMDSPHYAPAPSRRRANRMLDD